MSPIEYIEDGPAAIKRLVWDYLDIVSPTLDAIPNYLEDPTGVAESVVDGYESSDCSEDFEAQWCLRKATAAELMAPHILSWAQNRSLPKDEWC